MTTLLPLGSVVRLHHGKQKVMITTRFPLYNNQGTIGYFDYAGCLYPAGNTNNQAYFFNHENIAETYFTGYIDEQEEQLQERFKNQADKINYPRLTIEEL
ncbi:DUF4176 domain-containing protein [Streptococcus chenjunshii]|uniref:DUF4176 domain-containing protein n=1 Tax=Streptococcus chenjunshii TaxID=2173853 RepID=A0A372KJ07_9STRE|nr:DUF4176 domain-containing protein [Streptococcus chenjunshii]AXQ79531.1 DUF4176 domain-containing protein [Streptococcus chenjunshii]RFU50107.1 DUF4176 domain-containing protein [Streptococcus chenjunshii]RFU52259.1 DUF4176 domain-containing protein [Streptococcus chenjunshii]